MLHFPHTKEAQFELSYHWQGVIFVHMEGKVYTYSELSFDMSETALL